MTKKSETKKFRLSCKHLFLTYARCPLDLQYAIDQLKSVLFTYKVKSFLVVREEHNDENSSIEEDTNEQTKIKEHLHIYINTEKKVNITNPDKLHLTKDNIIYKGNYQASKSPSSTLDYLLKNFSTKEHPWILASPDLQNRITEDATITSFDTHLIELAKQNKIEEAMILYEKERPGDFLKNHISIEKSLKGLFLKQIGGTTKPPYDDFICPPALSTILEKVKEDKKTLLLIGEPGTGKTKFILFHLYTFQKLTPLIVNNLDSLRDFKWEKHQAIIFDDCNFKDVNREELIKLLDSEDETTHNVKHLSVRIPQNTPRFVISNKTFEDLFGIFSQEEAVKRRLYIYNLPNGTKLFGSRPITSLELENNLDQGKELSNLQGDNVEGSTPSFFFF